MSTDSHHSRHRLRHVPGLAGVRAGFRGLLARRLRHLRRHHTAADHRTIRARRHRLGLQL